MSLTNGDLSELLSLASESQEGHRQRALRSASRSALMWPEEAAALTSGGRSLTELQGVGPWVEQVIHAMLDDPPDVPDRPPFREGFLTRAEALAELATEPSWPRDLRGDLQMHTVYSDGSESVADMAGACAERGYEYIAITDHSKGLKIAGGMDEATLAQELDEVDRVNKDLESSGAGITILRALEMNIDPQGQGDMEPEALAQLELIIGSFHSQLRTEDDQTDRYLAMLENPWVQIVGHPRGRMYNRRAGLHAEWDKVFETAAMLGKAVEINAQPARQDLQVELLEIARETEVLFSIGTDAHYFSELPNMDFSLGAAIKAGIPRERIINFWPLERLREWAAGIRAAA